MVDSVSTRDLLLRREIGVMDPRDFEHLTFELAQRDEPLARRVENPDGGADVILPRQGGLAKVVWQAKRYADQIGWSDCEGSLTSALDRWGPDTVVFAFARDLSAPLEDQFERRLVSHPAARAAGTEVRLWNLSELVRRLAIHDDLKRRFFPNSQKDTTTEIARIVRAGAELQDASDVVERAATLTAFVDEHDRDFEYAFTTGQRAGRTPHWDDAPYMTLELGGQRERVQIAAWTRDGASVAQPTVRFFDNESGREARHEAIASWMEGDDAVLRTGVTVSLQPPKALKELVPDPADLRGSTIRMPAPEPFDAEVEIWPPDGTSNVLKLPVRPVPPMAGAYGALAGRLGTVLLEANFFEVEPGRSRATFTLASNFGPDARATSRAARLMHDWMVHRRMEFRSPQLFPDGIGGHADLDVDDDQRHEMEWRARFAGHVALIEDWTGMSLPLPDEVSEDDRRAVGQVYAVITTGEANVTFHEFEVVNVNPRDIALLPAQIAAGPPMRRDLRFSIFGRDVPLGEAEFDRIPLKVVKVVPHGGTPSSPARVVLGPAGAPEGRLKLIDWTPPPKDGGRPTVPPQRRTA